MKNVLPSLMQAAGVVAILLPIYMVAWMAGLIVTGFALLALGWALERP